MIENFCKDHQYTIQALGVIITALGVLGSLVFSTYAAFFKKTKNKLSAHLYLEIKESSQARGKIEDKDRLLNLKIHNDGPKDVTVLLNRYKLSFLFGFDKVEVSNVGNIEQGKDTVDAQTCRVFSNTLEKFLTRIEKKEINRLLLCFMKIYITDEDRKAQQRERD